MDIYLENPELLLGQPKKTIADYVEQHGILVPRRFESLAEARKSHKKIFLRSEHPQEYNGVSGLLHSFSLNNRSYAIKGMQDLDEIKLKYFEVENDGRGTAPYKNYCEYLGIDESDFIEQTSFSLWEYKKGVDRVVVADSAIPHRYHIMSHGQLGKEFVTNYKIVEGGKAVQEWLEPVPLELTRDEELIEIYEAVRHLDAFDPNHCPLMEFSSVPGKDLFLQYHRTRDFDPSPFMLDPQKYHGFFKAPIVRGATPEEGIACKVTFIHAGAYKGDYFEDGEGAYDLHFDFVYSELKSRARKLQIVDYSDIDWLASKIAFNHMNRSNLFKPPVSIVHDWHEFMNKDEEKFLRERARSGKNGTIDLHVVSDGRTGLIKRI